MPIELPHEVAVFLNFCGVPYPDINEDDVRRLGEHVREFAGNVQQTHDSATGAIRDMGSVYSGYSYEQLISVWARMSATHMANLDAACKVVAKALDIAADVITVIKVAVLAELGALALSYAAIIATPAGPATGPLLTAAARRICEQMEQNLIAYILGEVVMKAIEPLERTIDDMVEGVVYDAASNALGVPPPPSSSAVLPLHIEPDEVLRYAKLLDEHADDIVRHAENFRDQVSTLDFTTGGGMDIADGSGIPWRGAIDVPPIRTDFDARSTTSSVGAPRPSLHGSPDDHPAPANVRATNAGHEVTDKPAGVDNSAKVADGQHPSAADPAAKVSAPRGDLPNSMSSPAGDTGAAAPGGADVSAPREQISPRGDNTEVPVTRRADASAPALQPEVGVDSPEPGPTVLGSRSDTESATTAPGLAPFVPHAGGLTDSSAPATPWSGAPGTSAPRPTPGKSAAPKISRPAVNRPAEVGPTERKAVTSPWSLTRPPKVTAPRTSRATPWVRTDQKSESDRDADKPETRSTETESNVPATPDRPAVSAPEPKDRPRPAD